MINEKGEKRCSVCNKWMEPEEHFHRSNRNPDGWYSSCKICYKLQRSKAKEKRKSKPANYIRPLYTVEPSFNAPRKPAGIDSSNKPIYNAPEYLIKAGISFKHEDDISEHPHNFNSHDISNTCRYSRRVA